jgi:hypothetical protein
VIWLKSIRAVAYDALAATQALFRTAAEYVGKAQEVDN